jgi:hypothetical protein
LLARDDDEKQRHSQRQKKDPSLEAKGGAREKATSKARATAKATARKSNAAALHERKIT